MTIDPTELQTVLALPAENRYDFFLDHVVETGEIWGLGSDQWAIFSDDEQGYQLFPLWSDQDFAEANAQGEWAEYSGKSFTIQQFIDELIPQLIQANILLSIFKSPEDSGQIVDPKDIREILSGKFDLSAK